MSSASSQGALDSTDSSVLAIGECLLGPIATQEVRNVRVRLLPYHHGPLIRKIRHSADNTSTCGAGVAELDARSGQIGQDFSVGSPYLAP